MTHLAVPIPQFSLFLPDIRSGFNVGSFFRTADGFGVDHIFLNGKSAYPPHQEIAKTALGAEHSVSWSYHLDAVDQLKALHHNGVRIIALEIAPKAKNISKFEPKFPLCLIVGNEIDGVSKELLELADEIIFLPMKGIKESLNVSIAGSIALWEIAKKRYTA